MTSDEALIEKMAEAMWNCIAKRAELDMTWAQEKLLVDHANGIREDARAALSVVRDHDKKGLVHADSTGAERSSIASAVNAWLRNGGIIVNPAMPKDAWMFVVGKRAPVYVGADFGREERTYEWTQSADGEFTILKVTEHRRTDDRSAPAAPREPNLPSSLLSRLEDSRGLTRDKRS